ncbi:hypothetical protein FB567DRAFT_570299 [Paraphoma chrysanthemicola]|uniref:Heterokaryon incompatibility domain-containing protein n=1 Tax=Paraphoma chrysanthemicola TaxID=798071 RepID=A0A8K0R3Q2_9PLEO|nr:hypothetical protein FB567DRAFT_570299 [Paraphoma chrysanthemicola]
MDSNNENLDRTASLIVKLRYTPLCTKCVVMVSRWCLRPTFSSDTGSSIERVALRRVLLNASAGDAGTDDDSYSLWAWNVTALHSGASRCRCCKILWDVLNTCPWMHFYAGDIIVVRPCLVGSQHITPYQRVWIEWHYKYRSHDSTTDYKRFYRPMLQVYRRPPAYPSVDMLDDFLGRIDRKPDVPSPRAFILPAVNAESANAETFHDSDTFFGRQIGCEANIPLIKSWLHQCQSMHRGRNLLRDARCSSDDFEERSTPVDGCQPTPPTKIANFRLIDVAKRCVIEVDEPVEFAALSYVWGNAHRLVLNKNTANFLSTPGSLSSGKKDLKIKHIWIDALCIMQDDANQLRQHMDLMEVVYGSAILTICVQEILTRFKWGGTTYLSARRTFGDALLDSFWEKRAWCLQEKIFSKILLVFTEDQVFYHCAAATWFEDTIMEQKENISGSVHIREQRRRSLKTQPLGPNYTAYEAHRDFFGRNFWSLVEVYSQRELSYPSDTIRAFSGILNSVKTQVGGSIWGVPSFEFARGLTWAPTQHQMNLRKKEFPSWSWAGWQWNADTKLQFLNCKRTDADLSVSAGRYRIAAKKQARPSVWDLDWHHHGSDDNDANCQLQRVESMKSSPSWKFALEKSKHSAWSRRSIEVRLPFLQWSIHRWLDEYRTGPSSWRLPGHPRHGRRLAVDIKLAVKERVSTRQAFTFSRKARTSRVQANPLKSTIPPLKNTSVTDPPLQHIIRFHTSAVKVYIPQNPITYIGSEPEARPSYYRQLDYDLCIPESDTIIASVKLDPTWTGLGAQHKLIYISRWCPDFSDFWENNSYRDRPEVLNLLLVEDVPGWGEVKRRVQLVEHIDLLTWREAKPKWELVSLA